MGKLLADGFLCLLFRVKRDGCPHAADLSRCATGSKVHCTFSRGCDPLDSTDGAHCVLNHRSFPSVGSSLTRSWRNIASTQATRAESPSRRAGETYAVPPLPTQAPSHLRFL